MVANGSATTTLTVTVEDSYGNPVADGTAVTLTTDLGSLGATPYATTTTDGVATGTLTAGTTSGTATVQALARGITDTVTITLRRARA
jgi:adhesin/invasin